MTRNVLAAIIENKDRLNFGYLEKWAKKMNVQVFLKDEIKSLKLVKGIQNV